MASPDPPPPPPVPSAEPKDPPHYSGSDDLFLWQRMAAASVGGTITSLLTTPFDVVKIRLQAQTKPLVKGDCYIYSCGLSDHLCVHCRSGALPLSRLTVMPQKVLTGSWVRCNSFRGIHYHSRPSLSASRQCIYPQPCNSTGSSVGKRLECFAVQGEVGASRAFYRGSLDAAVQIVRNEGVTALWSGLPPTLLIALPGTVIYYTIYDVTKEQLGFNMYAKGEAAKAQAWIPPVTGALARIAAVFILSPLELARTKMQSESLSYGYMFRALRDAISTNGLRALWLGVGPTLLRDVPFSAIYWLAFDAMKKELLCRKARHCTGSREREIASIRLSFAEAFLMGATAGAISAFITLPADVIKTQRQIELGEALYGQKGTPAPSTVESIRRLYRRGGARVLFTGTVPRMIKIMPACAIMISSFEFMKVHFANRNT